MIEHDQREDYDDEPKRGPLAPERILEGPASLMWLLGLVQCVVTQLWMGFWACFLMLEVFDGNRSFRSVWNQMLDNPVFVNPTICWPIVTYCTIVVMTGAKELRRFRRYPLVFAAGIFTFLSIPCFFLAPFGVLVGSWVLVLLLRRDVRARFEAVARGTITSHSSEVTDARSDRSS